MVVNQNQLSDEQLARLAQSRAVEEERRRQDAARAEAEARRRAEESRMEHARRMLVAQTIDRLRPLGAGYEARLKIAESLVGPLCEYYRVDQELQHAESEILQPIPQQMRSELRRMAGLSANHVDVGLFLKKSQCGIVRVVLHGISLNRIQPGGIDYGAGWTTFDGPVDQV